MGFFLSRPAGREGGELLHSAFKTYLVLGAGDRHGKLEMEPDTMALTRAGLGTDDLLKARMSLGHVINDSHALSAQEYELIGRFVQTYCFADLESRRVIN